MCPFLIHFANIDNIITLLPTWFESQNYCDLSIDKQLFEDSENKKNKFLKKYNVIIDTLFNARNGRAVKSLTLGRQTKTYYIYL